MRQAPPSSVLGDVEDAVAPDDEGDLTDVVTSRRRDEEDERRLKPPSSGASLLRDDALATRRSRAR